jgi:hypothetical protein
MKISSRRTLTLRTKRRSICKDKDQNRSMGFNHIILFSLDSCEVRSRKKSITLFELGSKDSKRLKVVINNQDENEFFVDIGKMPSNWNLKQLAKTLNEMQTM